MKNSKWTPWLVVLAVLVVIAMFMVNAYNSMVNTQETATTALADVQATYQRRADLIPNLAKTVQAYAKHEKTTLTEVINARAAATQIKLDADNLTPEKIRQYESAQGELAQALGRLMVVAERYPDLKANQNFHSLQIQLEGTENRINEARQKYNEAVQDYNQTIRRFPNVLVAGMFGFDKMVKFEAAAGSDKAPVLNFD
ncbi:MAG: LemA family protein [Prevotellaceae bacterium]|jgi:LemA family protein|nr:LemA family protein [Prevotellaceae bacterium]MBF1061491.1 LemA family protein [Prevotellaceae bacterium]MBF1079652.1 LemA family protein [Prevotellaceae bacterium]